MMKENKTNTLLLTVIGVATLLVSVIGATFAYFTANISGQETETTVTVGAGTLSISYQDGTGILKSAEELIPNNEDPVQAAISKEFTVTGNNTTNAAMPYSLEIVVQQNTFTSNALEYKLHSTNTGANGAVVTATSNYVGIATGASTIALGSGYFSGVVTGSVHTYLLEIYFKDTGNNQDEDKNKEFTAYVNTKVQEIYTTTTQP